MHDFWTIATSNMTYTSRLQNYGGWYEIQTFEVVIVVFVLLPMSFDVFAPQVHIPFYFWTSGLFKYI